VSTISGRSRDAGRSPTDSEIIAYLRHRGLTPDSTVTVERLSGGVSNDVLAVSGAGVELVVKRALRRLRVAEEWLADPERVLVEGEALRVAAGLQPDRVPPVLDIDRDAYVIVIGRAERGAYEWKTDLLAGRVDLLVAGRLGTVLGRWHAGTAGDPEIQRRFGGIEAFDQLRIDPFYGWVSSQHPDLTPAIAATVVEMLARPSCLVHGDFSPKNVLLGPATTWVIDWEVAHYGDPAFDVAFLLTHLICKSLHRPAATTDYRAAADTFVERYLATTGSAVAWDESHVAAQTACLVLARIDGKSPAAYLDRAAQARGRQLARSWIGGGITSLDDMWGALL
jgi:hypothetical protein